MTKNPATSRFLTEEEQPPPDNDPTVKNTIDLVDLMPFDVQVALSAADAADNVSIFQMTDLVTAWMDTALVVCLDSNGYGPNDGYSDFDMTVLQPRNNNRRQLSAAALPSAKSHRLLTEEEEPDEPSPPVINDLYTASFEGATLFVREETDRVVPAGAVLACQRDIFKNSKAALRDSLQATPAVGLGATVVDVRAAIAPQSGTGDGGGSGNDDSLEVVIIVAIVIAVVAFLFLVFAIFWAWRYDKRNREAYLVSGGGRGGKRSGDSAVGETFDAGDSPESKQNLRIIGKSGSKERNHSKEARNASNVSRGGDSSFLMPSYPSVVGGDSVLDGGVYPESVISEDIESSISQYYSSGMAFRSSSGGLGDHNADLTNRGLQDAASVSSMESYGYSLDGYAPSMATPMPADLAGAPVLRSSSGNNAANTSELTDTLDVTQLAVDEEEAPPPSSAMGAAVTSTAAFPPSSPSKRFAAHDMYSPKATGFDTEDDAATPMGNDGEEEEYPPTDEQTAADSEIEA